MSERTPILFAVGLNHRTAPVEIRERIYLRSDEIPDIIQRLRQTLEEVVVLSTCNRTEIYGVTNRLDLDLNFYIDLVIQFKNAADTVTREHFFGSVSCSACQQLFNVATSLDSSIVGDSQILGQLREAYSIAKQHHSTGKIINQLFQKSFKIGKRTRHETSIHRGAISTGVAAVEFAERFCGGLIDKKVLLVGAGDTARLAAEALAKRRVGKLTIANRTLGHAEQLLARVKVPEIETKVIGLDAIRDELTTTDVVVSSLSTERPWLRKKDLTHLKRNILLIDLGVPRNISPQVAELDGAVLRNVDDLNEIIESNYQKRMENVPHVRNFIKEGLTEFLVWYYSLPLLPAEMKCGAKPDAAIQQEIVGVKTFLMKNLSWVHKRAMSGDNQTFSGHIAVVNELAAKREAELATAG